MYLLFMYVCICLFIICVYVYLLCIYLFSCVFV